MANATLRYRQAQYKSYPLIIQGRARYHWIANARASRRELALLQAVHFFGGVLLLYNNIN